MIEIANVSKRYGGTAVLDDVSLRARDGEVTGFIGHNGAGKSTAMRIVLGLTRADAGEARIDGERHVQARRPAAQVGALLSADGLPPRMTARGLLDYACRTQGRPRGRAEELIRMVGLEEVGSKRIGAYSLGMKQRLGMGLALVDDPRNLVLDEPVNGLDPNGVLWLRDLLRIHADRGGCVLLSSHLMSELSLVAERVVILAHGRVVREGRLDELGGDGSSRVYAESPALERLAQALTAAGFPPQREGRGVIVHGVGSTRVAQIAYESGAGLSHLSTPGTSLEDVFLSTTGTTAEREVAS
ncbi:ABC transporter ATP-binding protein [Clavibacter nebraskensis]|jgi:ABC-2 type transport system ATP-binding protein|uniref:ABC transporter ATP-binding protein n=1 Tax=Clavibacter nebraskensis TaxID=31963 RepID=UPI003F85E3C1